MKLCNRFVMGVLLLSMLLVTGGENLDTGLFSDSLVKSSSSVEKEIKNDASTSISVMSVSETELM